MGSRVRRVLRFCVAGRRLGLGTGRPLVRDTRAGSVAILLTSVVCTWTRDRPLLLSMPVPPTGSEAGDSCSGFRSQRWRGLLARGGPHGASPSSTSPRALISHRTSQGCLDETGERAEV